MNIFKVNNCKESSEYEFENLYQVVEFYVKEGETIPNKFDNIRIEQHDEICSIKKEVKILEFLKKDIKNNKLYIIARCEEIKNEKEIII